MSCALVHSRLRWWAFNWAALQGIDGLSSSSLWADYTAQAKLCAHFARPARLLDSKSCLGSRHLTGSLWQCSLWLTVCPSRILSACTSEGRDRWWESGTMALKSDHTRLSLSNRRSMHCWTEDLTWHTWETLETPNQPISFAPQSAFVSFGSKNIRRSLPFRQTCISAGNIRSMPRKSQQKSKVHNFCASYG